MQRISYQNSLATLLILLTGLVAISCSGNREPNPDPSEASTDTEYNRYQFESPHMGTLFRITLYAASDSLARRASDAAFQRIEELNRIMSDYLEESELNRVSTASGSGESQVVCRELLEVFQRSLEISRKTEGAFDITVGPYVQEWRAIRNSPVPRLPSEEELAILGSRVGYQHLILNPESGSVRLAEPQMQLDLGGIAKGYATQEALYVLETHGITSALIDGGGDITLGDPPPGRDSWTIAVPTSNRDSSSGYLELHLSNRTVATSGDLFQYIDIDGTRYSHILDPRTGLGVTEQRQVTVIAPNGMDADGYASAISVLGPEQGLALIEELNAIEARIEFHRNGEIYSLESGGFSRFKSE